MGRKNSNEYAQVCVYLRKSVVAKFKTYCLNQGQEYSAVAEEIFDNWLQQQPEDNTSDVSKFLKALAEGDKPSDADCIIAAHELGIKEELALKLRDRVFGGAKNGNGIPT